jgi:hypothetical protein
MARRGRRAHGAETADGMTAANAIDAAAGPAPDLVAGLIRVACPRLIPTRISTDPSAQQLQCSGPFAIKRDCRPSSSASRLTWIRRFMTTLARLAKNHETCHEL